MKKNQYAYGFTSPRKQNRVFQGSIDITLDENSTSGHILTAILNTATKDLKKSFPEEEFKHTDVNFTFISLLNTSCVK